MAPMAQFVANLRTANDVRHVRGCVVECGVWRGGMSAGLAEALGPDRDYFLFDSFEGLPTPTAEDGESAINWQKDVASPTYYDNCRAPIDFAEQAMKLSGVPRYQLVKGWFDRTLPEFRPPSPIAVLRLDGDWYESTLVALRSLAKYLAPGGVIIIDDYYTWDGCAKAVHEFLSEQRSVCRIVQKYHLCVIQNCK